MTRAKKVQSLLWKSIKNHGSNGVALRVISREVAGTNSTNRNSYDEDGNEYFLLQTEEENDQIERVKFKYIAKQIREKEKSPISENSSSIRFSCVSQDLLRKDYLKNKIVKGDKFYTFDGTEYSINQVNHVGHMQNMEFLLELECSRV